MRRIYLKKIGSMPRPDLCLLSNRVSGHDINRSNQINNTNGYKRTKKWQQRNKKRNQSQEGRASHITRCTWKRTGQNC